MATNSADSLAQSLPANAAHHLKQKRARSQLSCTPCRTGKLKCNREKPHCDQCIKRSREGQCLFVPPPAKHKPVQNVKGRIRQLEELVVDLMNQNRNAAGGRQRNGAQGGEGEGGARNGAGPFEQPTPPSDSDTSPQGLTGSSTGSHQAQSTSSGNAHTPPQDDVDEATTPFGQMHIGKDEISYVGEAHWGAILSSISELKRDLDDDEQEEETGPQLNENPLARGDNSTGGWPGTNPWHSENQDSVSSTSGLGFMLGNTPSLTKQQIITAVPEKRVADRLLSLWFNSPDPFKSIIHAPTFQDEYKRFWKDPVKTPTMWLSLLFAIMSLSASFGLRDVDPSSEQANKILDQVNKYHSISASAAVLSDFTKPKEHTIEGLIIYSAGLRSNNAFVNVWLMVGLIVRLALRMGFHRDAKHYPNITPFHGEMRRRIWSTISMIDVLISFQLGLPSMVKTIQSDTAAPRNLLDRDFNVNTTVLPPSRGIEELTPSSYARAKLGITRVFANAAELSHATIPPAYEEMMELDRQLEVAKAAIPPLLQMPDITEVVTDPAEQLMCRFNLDLLYLKTKIVLHRRYVATPLAQLSEEEQKVGIGHSRKTAADCALRVLQHHHTIYTASQPGGQLESVKWYMGSISTHDFLLAAMIICLELSQQINVEKFAEINPSGYQCPLRGIMMDALERSQKIWTNASSKNRTGATQGGTNGAMPAQYAPPGTAGLQGSNANAERSEHIFNETEKAARAIGVMIAKVRAQFPMSVQQQAEGTKYEPTKGQVTSAKEFWKSATLAQYLKTPERQAESPFAGMVSTYNWDIPEDFDFSAVVQQSDSADASVLTSLMPSAAPGSMRNPAANPMYSANNDAITSLNTDRSGSSEQDEFMMDAGMADMDFSMIGDMLQFPAAYENGGSEANIDWEMWDAQIKAGSGEVGTQAMSGNALTGGTGIVEGSRLPETWSVDDQVANGGAAAAATTTTTTAAGASDVRTTVPHGPSTVAFGPVPTYSWSVDESFELPKLPQTGSPTMDYDGADLADVDLGLDGSLQDYNRNGMYPATQADWQDWWRRKRTGTTPSTG
ncbi:hypothetical protein LTR78_006934 [Recurvomyces mirabilis]|uniref:Zn(2)-C6 fungal-type domain-containing protein n=1 Tax=Recurvomyces mirabilis TaxID=574656 RepID=A0AAE0WJY0_9PEZI|nr:hypothetical protein LTR78_006934 [Recurvomyces mirabilis]KAK5153318.1 hypothetical protein LTS14_007487 [Recurvomyces mirabilis]